MFTVNHLFKVKHNTALAISWLADSDGNTYEMSQNIADLYRKRDQINQYLNSQALNDGLAMVAGKLAFIRNLKSAAPVSAASGKFHGYKRAVAFGEILPTVSAARAFVRGWNNIEALSARIK